MTRHVFLISMVAIFTGSPVSAGGPASDFGRTYCAYYKNRAMAAGNADMRRKWMAEYRRCLKEKGEG